MKIAKKQRKIPIKLFLITLGLVIISAAGAFGLYESQKANKVASSTDTAARGTNSVDYNPPSQQEQKQQEDTKTDVIKQDSTSSPSSGSTSGSSGGSQDSSVTVTISRINQGGQGLPLNIRTIISGISGGTCTVELTKAGQPTITKTFPIIVQATYYTCQQADIAASEFSVNGDWSYNITAASGSTTSKPVTGTVTIAK